MAPPAPSPCSPTPAAWPASPFRAATPLNGTITLGYVLAQVPNSAASSYKTKALLHLGNIVINGSSTTAANSDGIEAVAYLGDVAGTGSFSPLDAALIGQVAVGIESGFSAFPATRPGHHWRRERHRQHQLDRRDFDESSACRHCHAADSAAAVGLDHSGNRPRPDIEFAACFDGDTPAAPSPCPSTSTRPGPPAAAA